MAFGSEQDGMTVTAVGYFDNPANPETYHPALRLNFNRRARRALHRRNWHAGRSLSRHQSHVGRPGAEIRPDGDGTQYPAGGIPDLFNIQEIRFDLGGFFSPDNEIFSWLPLRVDTIGLKFHPQPFDDLDSDGQRDAGEPLLDGLDGDGRFDDGIFHVDAAGNVLGIGDPLAFSVLFSGGKFRNEDLGDGFTFPIKATVATSNWTWSRCGKASSQSRTWAASASRSIPSDSYPTPTFP